MASSKLFHLALPTVSLDRARLREGSTFEIETALGRELVVSCPRHAARVWASDEELEAGKANQAIAAMVGPRSTASLDGSEHRERRRLVARQFTKEQAEVRGEVLRERAEAMFDRASQRTFVRLQPLFRRLFIDWLADVVLGTSFSLSGRALILARLSRLGDLAGLPLSAFAAAPGVVSLASALSRALPSLDLRTPIQRELSEARSARRIDPSSLLASWCEAGLGDAAIADEIVTYLGAGYDTTATAAAWMFDLVFRDGAARARLAAVGSTMLDDDARFVDACVREVLRLRPVLPLVSRIATRALSGFDRPVREGQRVSVALHLLHRDASAHASPERFDPSRFPLSGTKLAAYAPFGGGARRCPGMLFALEALRVTLRAALPHRPRPLGPQALPVLRGTTLAPLGGVPVVWG